MARMNGVLHGALGMSWERCEAGVGCCECRDFIGFLWASAVTGVGLGGLGGGGVFYKVDLRFREVGALGSP